MRRWNMIWDGLFKQKIHEFEGLLDAYSTMKKDLLLEVFTQAIILSFVSKIGR